MRDECIGLFIALGVLSVDDSRFHATVYGGIHRVEFRCSLLRLEQPESPIGMPKSTMHALHEWNCYVTITLHAIHGSDGGIPA